MTIKPTFRGVHANGGMGATAKRHPSFCMDAWTHTLNPTPNGLTQTNGDIPDTETAARTLGPHFVGSPDATTAKTPQNALGSKRVGNTNDMTTTTPTGNHGGAVMSCSPYAHPGFAEICTLH